MKLLLSALSASSCALAIAAHMLGSARAPDTTATQVSGGIVVEDLNPDSPMGRAGVRAGDILTRWERAPNPPANPLPERGIFHTPMNLQDVSVDQIDRGGVTFFLNREGVDLHLEIPKGRWDVFDALFPGASSDVYSHPRMTVRAMKAYRAGLDAIGKDEVDAGTRAWDVLARDIAAAGTNPELAVFLWLRAGTTLVNAGTVGKAQPMFDRAMSVAASRGMATALRELWSAKASAYWRSRDRQQSEKAFEEVIRLDSQQRRETVWTIRSLRGIALLQSNAGEPAKSLASATRALALARRIIPGSVSLARTLTSTSDAALNLGDTAAAERDAREALALAETLLPENNLLPYLITLDNALAERGDLAGAEALLRRALAFSPKDSLDEAFAAGNLGVVALRRRDLDEAERDFQRNLVIVQKEEPRGRREAICLINLGDVADTRGDYESAGRYYNAALEIQEKLTPGGPMVAFILNGLGFVAFHQGDFAAARSYQARALAIQKKLSPGGLGEAHSLSALGEIAAAAGNANLAADLYKRSLDIRARLAPGSLGEAESLHDLGLLERKAGRLSAAADLLRRSIEALDSQIGKLGGTEEGRGRFAANYAEYYRDYIDVLIRLERRQDAYRILEHSRARALLAMLAARDLTLAADIPANLLNERNSTAARYDTTLSEIGSLSPSQNPKDIDEALARLSALRAKQEQIADQIRKTSPRYASLKHPQPLSDSGTRAELDPGTLVLSYSVGSERTFLFAIEPSFARAPGMTVSILSCNDSSLRKSVEAYRNLLEAPDRRADDSLRALTERGRTLYDVLIKPVEPLMAKYDRVLILPDGPLHTLPFAALVRSVKDGKPEYLVEWKPIHMAVSATVYSELKRGRKEAPRDPSVMVAAFGDPKYPRLADKKVAVKRGEGKSEDGTPSALLEEFAEVEDPQLRSVARGGFRFEPLPASRREVEEIVSLYAPKSAAYLGPDATEERAKSIGKDVPLIHFATHAVINERFPLDSALVFTIPEHPKGGQDNGLLQAWEIFERVRIDADLVTLSACDSGLGKEMGGEGLLGLTRAFQYAGARSVLASLWKVEDRSTGELMKWFYQHLKAGKTKDEALRLAQIDLIHSAEFGQPADWAAFQLHGDWR